MKPIVKSWTEENLTRLRQLALSSASVTRCSAALNRSTTSIMKQARKMGLPIADKRKVKAAQRAKISAAEDKLRLGGLALRRHQNLALLPDLAAVRMHGGYFFIYRV